LAIFFCLSSIAQTNSNHVKVKGYYKKNGTYVQPHYRTAPNSTKNDNFSTEGNTNPYTGKPGWINRDNNYNTLYYTDYTYSYHLTFKNTGKSIQVKIISSNRFNNLIFSAFN
jgi:hypothetical protein